MFTIKEKAVQLCSKLKLTVWNAPEKIFIKYIFGRKTFSYPIAENATKNARNVCN